MSTQIELNERHYRSLHAIFDYMNVARLTIVELNALAEANLVRPSDLVVQKHLFTAVGLGVDNQVPETIRLIMDFLRRCRLTIVDDDVLYDAGIPVNSIQQDRTLLYAAVGIDRDALTREQDALADSLRRAW